MRFLNEGCNKKPVSVEVGQSHVPLPVAGNNTHRATGKYLPVYCLFKKRRDTVNHTIFLSTA